ncbi:MAG: DEAD/DEAH box helicase family protein [Alphaproteobacteria bacterium]|nr:DEAD/DEAH box helicase family protein [Alphaproteobacteria bacterium]
MGLFDGMDLYAPVAEKIALFRSLFRGREDVYARRFDNPRTGKSGYSPACANEWVSGKCARPKVKCARCGSRQFLPLTDEVVRQHLSGEDARGRPFVVGIYPLMVDEHCAFLAYDFDKSSWREDVAACLEVCRLSGLPAALERSRSGQGAHLWLFFEEPVSASLARRLGAALLTRAMENRPGLGFGSYDRLFPNQDTMPQGGFGNLIALPLQKKARQNDNSVFLDDGLQPWGDQWAFLGKAARIARRTIETLVEDAERRGRVFGVRLPPQEEDAPDPWNRAPSRRVKAPEVSGDLPKSVELVLGNQVYLAKTGLPPELRTRLLRLAAFQNPAFYKAQAQRLSTHNIPRIIACAEDLPQHIALPRGLLEDIEQTLRDLGIDIVLNDQRNPGQALPVTFQGELREGQRVAAEALLAHDTGVLAATTAFGKTVIAAWLIARRQVNTLVLVHRRDLLEQWMMRLASFLGPDLAIGRIGGGKRKANGLIDVAMIQSLIHKHEVDDALAGYGQIIVDECHHLSAQQFETVVREAKARYVTGLSATVVRKDGTQPIIFMQCGPVRHRVDARAQAASRPFEHKVLVRPTEFRPRHLPQEDSRQEFQALIDELGEDHARNRHICEDVVKAAKEGRAALVLTQRVTHLERLVEMLSPRVRNLVVLRAGSGKKERQAQVAQLAAIAPDAERVVIATGQHLGEGFDDPRLDTLFLAMPVSWKGTVAQYAGRLHRVCDGKAEVRIHDYADLQVPMLAKMFNRRCRAYEAEGYLVVLPAGTGTGPAVDGVVAGEGARARDPAASVQRLLRDAADAAAPNLFVKAAATGDGEAEDKEQSSAQALLLRRLESLPATEGRFQITPLLPIALDSDRNPDPALVCAEASVVVELDDLKALGDAAIYRRNRRRDRLLQENGYFVLRFLGEDVVGDPDGAMGAILKALQRRQS